FLKPDRPLIFTALGTQAFRYPWADDLFHGVIALMKAHPEWQMVLAVGPERVGRPPFLDVPDNVLVLARAPQLWLLPRAAAFITHGGINSVLEAIRTETPMLVVPQGYDQPGNAARVAFHGAGALLEPQMA